MNLKSSVGYEKKHRFLDACVTLWNVVRGYVICSAYYKKKIQGLSYRIEGAVKIYLGAYSCLKTHK